MCRSRFTGGRSFSTTGCRAKGSAVTNTSPRNSARLRLTRASPGASSRRLMELYFRDGGDLPDTNVLLQAAADCGLDADDVRKRLATDEDVELISAQAKEASDKGISGVPTFVFAQKYAVSGAQPAEQLARAIRQV